jgi:hypothetical protein
VCQHEHSGPGSGFGKIGSQMSALCPIGRTELEKSDEIPKSFDHPSKPFREKLSWDRSKRWILVRLLNRIRCNARFLLCQIDPKNLAINSVQESYDYPFLTANSRLIFDPLPKGSKSNRNYFIDNLLPALNQVRTGNDLYKVAPTLAVHRDNSMRYNRARSPRKRR